MRCLFVLAAILPMTTPSFGNTLSLWQRVPGIHANGSQLGKANEKQIDLSRQSLTPKYLRDVQYGYKQAFYRGFWLENLIKEFQSLYQGDYILLHFSNEMVVPLPLTHSSKNLKIFLALETRPTKRAKWQKSFEPIARADFRYRDPIPLKFKGNKLVVNTAWHSFLKDSDVKSFSPWRQVGSLVGIEFAERNAYNRQFSFGGEAEKAGQKVFLSRCQFCHGVRGVGAQFGWDFVDPLPIYQKRQAEELLFHVKYPKAERIRLGIQMPHQPGFSRKEADAIWAWMKAAALEKPKPYKP